MGYNLALIAPRVFLFEDEIVYRKLFKGRDDQNLQGMKSEYLLILEKKETVDLPLLF